MNERIAMSEKICTQLLDVSPKWTGRYTAVLTNVYTGAQKIYEGPNIITTAGDLFYAQRSIGALPTNFTDAVGAGAFDAEMWVAINTASANGAPGKASTFADLNGDAVTGQNQPMESGFPALNDATSGNTGGGVSTITYHVLFATGEANGTLTDVMITNPGATGSEPALMHAEFGGAGITKTSSDTLAVFINHSPTGV